MRGDIIGFIVAMCITTFNLHTQIDLEKCNSPLHFAPRTPPPQRSGTLPKLKSPLTGNDHAGIQIAPPIGDTRSAVEKGGAGSPFLACMRYFAWVHRRQGRKGMQG